MDWNSLALEAAAAGRLRSRMLGRTRVTVVMPAYEAAETLRQTVEALDRDVVDDVILVDDSSRDETVRRARDLGIFVYRHERNLGYGGNQKSCYRLALERGADIVVMVHPDYQYEPRLVPALAGMIHSDVYDVVPGSRILGGRRAQGRDAAHQVSGEPVSDGISESVEWGEVVGVSHGLSRLFQEGAGDAAVGGELGRFFVRQPNVVPGGGVRISAGGGVVPNPLFSRSVFDQSAAGDDLRVRGDWSDPATGGAPLGLAQRTSFRNGRPPAFRSAPRR